MAPAGSSTPLAKPIQWRGAITRRPGRSFSHAPHHENELLLVTTTSAPISSCRSTIAGLRRAAQARLAGELDRNGPRVVGDDDQLVALALGDRRERVAKIRGRQRPAAGDVEVVGAPHVHADVWGQGPRSAAANARRCSARTAKSARISSAKSANQCSDWKKPAYSTPSRRRGRHRARVLVLPDLDELGPQVRAAAGTPRGASSAPRPAPSRPARRSSTAVGRASRAAARGPGPSANSVPRRRLVACAKASWNIWLPMRPAVRTRIIGGDRSRRRRRQTACELRDRAAEVAGRHASGLR